MDAYHGVTHAIGKRSLDNEIADNAARPLASTKRVSVAADADGVLIVKKIVARIIAERIIAAGLRAVLR
jgi:hypothetical protein